MYPDSLLLGTLTLLTTRPLLVYIGSQFFGRPVQADRRDFAPGTVSRGPTHKTPFASSARCATRSAHALLRFM